MVKRQEGGGECKRVEEKKAKIRHSSGSSGVIIF